MAGIAVFKISSFFTLENLGRIIIANAFVVLYYS